MNYLFLEEHRITYEARRIRNALDELEHFEEGKIKVWLCDDGVRCIDSRFYSYHF